ncbi:ATP-binding cassette domain-containing protein [Flavisolibacter tropicus]|uniref:ABC transporter ATP-binding protein n=1 Tax=Flavisolibacter tropicus TaxID=1492898 RepID=A0A172U1B4_9BACT|nr:ATP-binding cassette domain-containing protein [Flavisolibacter tropicus]ANE53012.1 hypothetical protein SY85_23600 [Flavisolibacter tropicus]
MIQTFRKTIGVLTKEEKRKFYLLAFFSLFISIADIVSLALLVVIVGFYTGHALPSFFSVLPLWLVNKESFALILLLLFVFLLKNLAGYLHVKTQNNFVYNVASRLADNNLFNYLDGSYTDYVYADSAIHVRRIGQLPIEFCHHVLSNFQQVITESILVVLTIIAILIFNTQLFILLFVFLLPPVFLLGYFIKKKLKDARFNIKTNGEITLQYLHEALSSYVESNIHNRKQFFVNRYSTYRQKLNKHLTEIQIVQGTSSRIVEVFAILGFFILITINITSGSKNGVEIVTIGAFMAAAYKIIPGIVKLLNLSGQIKAYEFAIPEISLISEAIKKPVTNTQLRDIRFEKVVFHYEGRTILRELSFTITSGDIVGIKGDSGIGKTTALNLLLGFLPIGKGSIYFNGQPVAESERKQFWNRITYVKQQPFLMHNTVLANITLSENGYDAGKVDYAINASGLQPFINKFPEGLQKEINESGKNISGGQQQRINIARALYKEADLIILDEPFNELDPDSEKQILEHCQQLAQAGKMIILISHNAHSLTVCNKMINLHAS